MGTVPSTQAASSDEEYMAALQASSAALQALNTRIYSSRDRDHRERPHRVSASAEHDDSPTDSDEVIAEEVIAGSEQPPGCDTHRWRKYGCKHVRQTKDFRNYYKCSVKDCNVKKIEHVHFTAPGAPPTIKIQVRGEHAHSCQVTNDVKKLKLSSQEDFRALLQSKGDSAVDAASAPAAEKRKHRSPSPAPALAAAGTAGQQLVVVASGEVDPADDGWQWRKYGQKQVKDSPFPRSYYRCSLEDCPARKKVQSSLTQRYITYEGQHNHPPPVRVGKGKKRKSPAGKADDQSRTGL